MQRKLCKRVTFSVLLGLLLLGAGQSPSEIVPLEEVERGMIARGWSVFAGSEPEPFDAEVLGVWRDVSPGSSYILARLSGRGLEQTGVIAGMSGSPLYVGDRLLGAVAFSWPFAKDAIAGVTPIASMRALASVPAVPVASSPPVAVELVDLVSPPPARDRLLAALAALGGDRSAPANGVLWSTVGLGSGTRSLLSEAIGGTVVAGSAGELPADLEPGDAVAAVLIGGDLKLAATGTVTDRLGSSVLAFGHPFLSLGDVTVPMATAEIVTVVSSLSSSFKIGNVGQIVGRFDRDRPAGIHGVLGAGAPLLPVTVEVTGLATRSFEVGIARVDPVVGSLLATTVLGALDTASGTGVEYSLELTAEIQLAGRESLSVRQSFDGRGASLGAAVHLLNLVTWVMNNPLERLEVEAIDVGLEQRLGPLATRVVAAHVDRPVVEPGSELVLSVELEPYRGEPRREQIPVQLPADLEPGRYFLFVGDGASVDGARLELEKSEPVRIEQALSFLNGLHSRSELVVLGVVPAPGLAVEGETMARLPSSVREIWSATAGERKIELSAAIRQQIIHDVGLPLEGLVRVDLEVKSGVFR